MTTMASRSASIVSAHAAHTLELVCQAVTPIAARAAIDNGADWVRIAYRPANRPTERIDFCNSRFGAVIRHAHAHKRKIVLDLDALSQPSTWARLCRTIAHAHDAGIDAIALSDPALILHSTARYPHLPLHYTAPMTALSGRMARYLHLQLGVSRIVMPRVLSLAQLDELASLAGMDLEVFGFGRLCAIVASPEQARHGGPIHSANARPPAACGEHDGGVNLPPPEIAFCANGDTATNDACYSAGGMAAGGALNLLPRLQRMGIRAIRVETGAGAPGDVAQLARVWREAIDSCAHDVERFAVKPGWISQLDRLRKARC